MRYSILFNFFNIFSAIREDGMPGGRNKSIGPVQVGNIFLSIVHFNKGTVTPV